MKTMENIKNLRLPLILGIILLIIGYNGVTAESDKDKEAAMSEADTLLLDEFKKDGGESAIGTTWETVTDRVMGGISEAEATYEEIDGVRCIHLRGDISLENNGGFVQIGLPLKIKGKAIDGREYKGVRLRVKGNNEKYYINLKTSRTYLPWMFFRADFMVTDEWQTIEIPFERFEPEGLKAKFSPAKLKRIAVVGMKKEFTADIYVSRLELYK